jgi:hypothetical protein
MEKVIDFFKWLKEASFNYESDEDFMSRIMKEYNENNLTKIN